MVGKLFSPFVPGGRGGQGKVFLFSAGRVDGQAKKVSLLAASLLRLSFSFLPSLPLAPVNPMWHFRKAISRSLLDSNDRTETDARFPERKNLAE